MVRRLAASAGMSMMSAFCLLASNQAIADDATRFFRIGTGGEGGTYYPVGSLIALALTASPDNPACAEGSCGVSDLVTVAQLSGGSVANVEAIAKGSLEAALAQGDVVHWAYTGTGVFDGQTPNQRLRAIANLYPESMHLVALEDSGIRSVAELRGRRVSLDDRGSGTLVDARLVLSAFGLAETDLQAQYVKPSVAMQRLSAGQLDAFFFVGGFPIRAVSELASTADIRLVPVSGDGARELLTQFPFFSAGAIPAATYRGVGTTPTINVNAQLIVRADLGEDLVHEITRTLWEKSTLRLLAEGHPKGSLIKPEDALAGLSIPLHPGAKRYYRSVGLLK